MSSWYAQTPAAHEFMAAAAGDPGAVLLAMDFDGTLAPIVDDPESSRMHEVSAVALGRLGRRLGQLAIVTGRAVATVRRLGRLSERPGLGTLIVFGQYGAERWDARTGVETDPEVPDSIAAARDQVLRVAQECRVAGVVVEDKGRALGLHTRRAEDPKRAFDELRPEAEAIAAAHGLALEPGRDVLELRASTLTKGDALHALVIETGATLVAMCGDDLGDLPAFEALRELGEAGMVRGCVVVSASTEVAELDEQADILAQGPDGMAAWLMALADAVGGE